MTQDKSVKGTDAPRAPEAEDKALDRQEAEARIQKLKLEQDKLRLEKRSLRRQLSFHGVALEWLKASTVPAALIGVFVTLYVGIAQLRQAQDGRSAERLESAITRLSSTRVNERLAGVAALRLLVYSNDRERQYSALHFLISALSIEEEVTVQDAITDLFRQLEPKSLNAVALSNALTSALERNRFLTRQVVDSELDAFRKATRERASKLLNVSLDQLKGTSERIGYDTIPEQTISDHYVSQLSFHDYIDLFSSRRHPFEGMEAGNRKSLYDLAQIIQKLISLGATATDFSGIYCEGCNFANAVLPRSNFERAYLSRSDFSRATLPGSIFRNADLVGVTFFSANLAGADLSVSEMSETTPAALMLKEQWVTFPILTCATLTGANLYRRPLTAVSVFAQQKPVSGKTSISLRITTAREDEVIGDKNIDVVHIPVVFSISLSDVYLNSDMPDSLKDKLTSIARSADSAMRKTWYASTTNEQRERTIAGRLTDVATVGRMLPPAVQDKVLSILTGAFSSSGWLHAGDRGAVRPRCTYKSSPRVFGSQTNVDLQLDGN